MKTLLLLVTLAHADTTTQPCGYAKASIIPQLSAAKMTYSMAQAGDSCVVTWTPKKGVTIAYDDKQARLEAIKASLSNWDSLTAAQKDALLKAVLRRLLEVD